MGDVGDGLLVLWGILFLMTFGLWLTLMFKCPWCLVISGCGLGILFYEIDKSEEKC